MQRILLIVVNIDLSILACRAATEKYTSQQNNSSPKIHR